MWKLLCSLFDEPCKSSVETLSDEIKEDLLQVDEAPRIESEPKLREPVQVLLDSIEEGWWDFEFGWVGTSLHSDPKIVAKHEWLRTTLTIHNVVVNEQEVIQHYQETMRYYATTIDWAERKVGKRENRLSEAWMTEEENKLVCDALLKARSKLAEQRKKRAVQIREGQFFKLLELKEK